MIMLAGCGGSDVRRRPPDSESERVHPNAGAAADVREVRTGDQPCALVAAGGSIWVSHLGSEDVTEIAADGTISRRVPVPGSPCWMAADDAAASGCRRPPRLARTGRRGSGLVGEPVLIADIAADARVAVGHGSVWATVTPAGELVRIDPVSQQVLARISTGTEPRGLLVTADLVWVANAVQAR